MRLHHSQLRPGHCQTIGNLLYNCFKLDEIATRSGFTKLGVEKAGTLFARGVLLDVAAYKGVHIGAVAGPVQRKCVGAGRTATQAGHITSPAICP